MRVNVINNSENPLPKYESEYAAGLDLRASFKYITPENPLKLYGEGEIVFAGEHHAKTMLRLEPGSRAICLCLSQADILQQYIQEVVLVLKKVWVYVTLLGL